MVSLVTHAMGTLATVLLMYKRESYFDGCYNLETALDIALLRGRAAAHRHSKSEASMLVSKTCERDIIYSSLG